MARVEEDRLILDPRFNLDFNTAIPGLRGRPHGMDAMAPVHPREAED